MTYFTNYAYFLFAENNTNTGNPYILPFLLIGGMFFMFYMMTIPQKRERKRWNDMVESLKKNDRVLMSCGIIGKVHSVHIDKNEVVVKVDDDSNTKMTFSLAGVNRVLEQAE